MPNNKWKYKINSYERSKMMARESTIDPSYKILAYLTANEERKISGAALFLKLTDEEELKETTADIAKALKADVVKLKNNDYLIINL
jgi:hypothetical protein